MTTIKQARLDAFEDPEKKSLWQKIREELASDPTFSAFSLV